MSEKSSIDNNFFEMTPVPCFLCDSEGVILEVNPAYEVLVGLSRQELCKKELRICLAEKYREAFLFFVESLHEKRFTEFKQDLVFQNGEEPIPAQIHITPGYDHNGRSRFRVLIFDLRELQGKIEKLEQERERYQIIAEQSHDILFEYLINQDLLTLSSSYSAITGKHNRIPHFTKAVKKQHLVHPDDISLLERVMKEMRVHRQRFEQDIRIDEASGLFCWYRVFATLLYEEGLPSKLVGSMDNVDRIVMKKEEMLAELGTDPLTKLFNREAARRAVELFLREKGKSECHALLLVDVDELNHMNERLGHIFGDNVLMQAAVKLRQMTRGDDILGRIGGDQFVILLKNTTSHHISRIASRICDALSGIDTMDDPECKIISNVGIALFPHDDITFCGLFEKAESALCNARLSGKKGYRFFSDFII